MKIRHLRESDLDQVYSLFNSVSVNRQQLALNNIPKSGFYEYHLEESDFKRRLDTNFSLCLEAKGKLVAYILAYPISRVKDGTISEDSDPVLKRLSSADSRMIYLDQFFMQPGLPAYLVGRITNVWDTLLPEYKIPGVVAAIPQKPWKNKSSTRFAIHRGFKREGILVSESVELGLFTKPILSKDVEFGL